MLWEKRGMCEMNYYFTKWKKDGSEGEEKGAYMLMCDESYFSMDVSSFYIFFYLFIYIGVSEPAYVHFN